MVAGFLGRAGWCAVLTALALGMTATGASAHEQPSPQTRFFVPAPNPGALTEIRELQRQHDRADARLLRDLVRTPQAVWFTSGTPAQVHAAVRTTMERAADQGATPVLVSYFIP